MQFRHAQYDAMAKERIQDRSDVLRAALVSYARVHGPRVWTEGVFGVKQHDAVGAEALSAVTKLRESWFEREDQPESRDETAQLVHRASRIVVEIALLAADLQTDVDAHAERRGAASTTVSEAAEQLHVLARRLYNASREITSGAPEPLSEAE